jgi:ABC-type lipoprotein release transport system permease subunit
MIGSASLCLTLMVTSGFEKEISQKARGMSSDAVVTASSQQPILWAGVKDFFQTNFPNIVDKVSATSIGHVVADHKDGFYNLILKAVDTKTFAGVSDFCGRITPILEQTGADSLDGKFKKGWNIELGKILSANNLIIGHKLARNLKLKLGDELKLLLPEPSGKRKVRLREVLVKVAGFLDVGFSEFDSATLICSLELFWQFFDLQGQVQHLLLKFKDQQHQSSRKALARVVFQLKQLLPWLPEEEVVLAKMLEARLNGFKVQSWKELYPALVSSMRLEKYAMFFVLLLVSIVAIMNMVSLLIVQVQAKRKDIAILRTVGFSQGFIKQLFVTQGLVLTFFASGCGVLLAFAVGWFFTHVMPIRLPDAYFVSNLPFDLAPQHFLLVFTATMLVSLIASWFPAHKAASLNIIEVLRGH